MNDIIPKLCELFRVSNYDVKILDKLPVKIRNMFKNASIEARESDKITINKPLAVCIYNHYYGEQVKADFISGIGEASYYVSKDKTRKVYIFHDWTHTLDYKCNKSFKNQMDFNVYLKHIFDNSDVFIDFFCEYGKYQRKINDSFIKRTDDNFRHCSEGLAVREGYKCPSNIRMHFTDIRHLSSALNDIFKENVPYDSKLYIKQLDEYLLLIIDKTKFNAMVKKELSSNPYILKQFKKTSKEMVDKIKNFILEHAYDLMMDRLGRKGLSYYLTLIRYYKNKISKNELLYILMTDKYYYDYYYVIGACNVFIMDAYLLARMFKKFDVKNSFDPEYAKNTVIYAGSAHCVFYEKFLESIGYERLYYNVFKNQNLRSCLDVKSMPQPLFKR